LPVAAGCGGGYHALIMQLVDSHCHINFPDFAEAGGVEGLLSAAAEQDVRHLLCVAVNLEDYPEILQMARHYDNIFASVGVHPNETEGVDPQVEELVELGRDPAVVAIGETGLDYFRSEGDLSWQRQRFERHIQASRTVQKPIIVHTRDAEADTVDILRSEFEVQEAGGVLHCFTGSWQMARQCLDLGLYISFSGIVTFKSATELQDVARKVPDDRLLIETDAPFLAPVPMRGKTNQPSYVRHVAEFLAVLRDQPLADIARHTTDNFFNLFSTASRQ